MRIEVQDVGEHLFMKNRPEENFPLKRTRYEKLYLDASDLSMKTVPCPEEKMAAYESGDGQVTFDYRFEEDTEITGYMKLRLYVAAESYDDMDLFVNIQKLDTQGNWAPVTIFGEPHPGVWGKLRVSRRKLDEKLSTDYNPVQAHTVSESWNPDRSYRLTLRSIPPAGSGTRGSRSACRSQAATSARTGSNR